MFNAESLRASRPHSKKYHEKKNSEFLRAKKMSSKLLLAKKTFSNMLLPKQVLERREEGFVVTEKKFCIKLDFYVVRRILLSTYCTLSTLSSTANSGMVQ